jgi:hypothetical protein
VHHLQPIDVNEQAVLITQGMSSVSTENIDFIPNWINGSNMGPEKGDHCSAFF